MSKIGLKKNFTPFKSLPALYAGGPIFFADSGNTYTVYEGKLI